MLYRKIFSGPHDKIVTNVVGRIEQIIINFELTKYIYLI